MDKHIPYIDIQDISMFYPVRGGTAGKKKSLVKAVNGVSLQIEKGEILGVIGESGCGKSTLGRMLVRLENPTLGDVLIEGHSTNQLIRNDRKQFCRAAQIIFQNPFETFTPRDTIEKIMKRPLRNHGIGKNDAERHDLCVKALENGGLVPAEDFLRRYPHELSGGQLQRISILRSMLLNPSFIVADEPVSMLDVSVRAEIINMFLDMSRAHNASVVFISHDIALTRYISDKVAVMYLGRIVEYGSADDVVKNPKHPYTQALISNCASIDPFEENHVIPIVGEPPTPINPGPGCFFADRCPQVVSDCLLHYPETYDIGGGHTVSCIHMNQFPKV